jgi:hypothetical protein
MAPQSERNVVVVDAPSNLGLSPPSPGAIPGCSRLAEVLREQARSQWVVASLPH